MTCSPACNAWSGIESRGSGARFETVTSNDCVAAWPAGSLAETVTRALPRDTPITVSAVPDTETDTTAAADDAAV